MIAKIDVDGVHYKIPEDVVKYARKKIGGLDSYMSSHSRKSVHAGVKLKESPRKNDQRFSCEAVMFLPHGKIAATAAAKTIQEAIDLCEHKLSAQLKRYKEKHQPSRNRGLLRRVARRLKRQTYTTNL